MKIAYIFNHYPVLTQRFLQREIDALRAQGIEVETFAIFGPAAAVSKIAGREEKYLSAIPATIFALRNARLIRRSGIELVHGAWATGPATVAAILHQLCAIPFSFGAQAHDLYRHGGDPFLRAKLRAAAFVHTTTQENVTYLKQFTPRKMVFARRGLDEIPAVSEDRLAPPPWRILSVGRLVAKKGYQHQLAACAELKQSGVDFNLRIIGDGPLRADLEDKILRLGLSESVVLEGALPPEKVDAAYRESQILWHTGVVDVDGDRDGLPNVIPEAMAHQLAVISHRAAGAMEAVSDGETGLLVEPGGLAAATKRLLQNPALRDRLGANARRWVEENFLAKNNAAILAEAFQTAVKKSV